MARAGPSARVGEKQRCQMADRGRLFLQFGQHHGAIGEMSIPEIKSV
jgi:hypothetical protein